MVEYGKIDSALKMVQNVHKILVTHVTSFLITLRKHVITSSKKQKRQRKNKKSKWITLKEYKVTLTSRTEKQQKYLKEINSSKKLP